MPYNPIAFESSRVTASARQDIREARERVLEKAKDDYERRKEQEERARQRGDDKWMLASVEARLADEGKSAKRKKSSKHKKSKKKKKKHKRRSSSSSGSESSGEEQWVEKRQSTSTKSEPQRTDSAVQEKTSDQPVASTSRDEWMTLQGIIPCVTRTEIQQQSKSRREQELEEKKKKNLLDQPGQSARELNPYWKDGGTGLPEEQKEAQVQLASKTVGDQGVGWLKKALQRIHEQAAETGRSADDIAADRWGSLSKLEDLIAEAEQRQRPKHWSSKDRRDRDQGRDSYRRSRNERPRFSKPDDDYRESRRERSSYDSRSREGRRGFLKPDVEREDSRYQRPSSRPSGSRNWQKREPSSTDDKPSHSSQSRSSDTPSSRPSSSRPHKKESSDSSTSEDDEKITSVPAPEPALLSDKDMNEIGAKIVKAEILGDEDLAKELKAKLESARQARAVAKATGSANKSDSKHEDVVILTRTDAKGMTHPLEAPQHPEPSGGRRRKQKVQTHNKQGERERYFPDDDKYRLQDMFTREKLNTVEDSNYEFAKLIGKSAAKLESGEGDLDDMFEANARYKEADGKQQRREREMAMREHHRVTRALDDCRHCVDSKQMLKHLIVALGNKVYLSLPSYQSLTPGHCLLAPTLHTPCGTHLDEDVWEEMQVFRKAITRMFAAQGEDVVFFETARNLRNFPHMILECVPLDRESGSLAPIYFKKAIQECEAEWSTNKKLVELGSKGLRRSIPKGLPYFAVFFGDDDGFGHVIEDEKDFPPNFAQEIIGGMLDLDHHLWRKRHNENFEAQRRKVVEFAKNWAPYDFTQKKKSTSSSSDSD